MLSPDLGVQGAPDNASGMQTSIQTRSAKAHAGLSRFVAFDESNNNVSNLKSLTHCNVCSYGQTGGEILIPTSTIVAGLGHIFSFHRAR
jgi:hypothetical protein